MTDPQVPMGGGVNQRAQIKMSESEIEAFLAERRPWWTDRLPNLVHIL